ncbi:DUF4173 domain-containing protein [Actinoplanes sp. TRM 88003]|uniref:DUF4173 domain-containing protein n=1 Tax=Paractinoplanes aksuensis TaxID=2939490 RepID=A0ABT1DWU3_9ACTN|nr:DUF4173 domain-containing protein [Actinoplanes aksuensis]MCO8275341.1 DUF4173 domain-containing protein [Actinoplanes aksuensis]
MSLAPSPIPAPQTKPLPVLHGPWPSTAPWAKHWPGPVRPASALTVAAVAGAAVVAALSLPLDRPGVGWLLTALAGLATAIVAAPAPATGGPPPLVVRPRYCPGPERVAWGTATLALFAVGTFRSAGWLFVLCLLVSTLTGALALAGGRSMRSIFAAYTMPFVAAFRALPWLTRGLTRINRPNGGAGVRIVATAGVSVVLLGAFGGLLASADLRFAEALERLVPDLGVDTVFRWVFVGGLAVFSVGAAAYLRSAPPNLSNLDGTEGRKVHRWEWAVPLGLLTLLFGAFVLVQATGQEPVRAFADEARQGFWQLSFVVGLTLLVLAGAARWAPRDKPADRILIRVILGVLTGLTLVIAATALHRINLYTDEYGLTRLRLLVFWCELWFVFVLLLILVAGRKLRAPWLPRVAIAAGVLALLGLAVANPDGVIAERNLRHSNQPIDLAYLSNLSPDAVPALMKLPDDQRACVLRAISDDLRPGDWRTWNLGSARARTLVNGQVGSGQGWC